jgi:hypothetical protein
MRKINWENWNVKEEEQTLLDEVGVNVSLDDIDDDELEDMMMKGGHELERLPMNIEMTSDHIIVTPFGMYNATNPFIPSRRWECWIGHTNFNIGLEEANIVKVIEGVESLSILGRYTFCIGVPKYSNLFSPADTKVLIEEALCSEQDIDVVRRRVSGHKYWAVLVRADGSLNYACSKKKDGSYKKQIEKLEHLRNNYGGKIFSSVEYPEF